MTDPTNPTIDKLIEITERVKQLCIIAENDGKNDIVYFPKPYEYGPREIKQAIIAWALEAVDEAIVSRDFTKEVKEYHDRVKAKLTGGTG